jgi:hypothetical protein
MRQDAFDHNQGDVDSDHSRASEAENSKFVGGRRFDWLMVALTGWMIGGIYLDGWAHNHAKVDSSFFTPWHAFLYSGYLAVTIALGMSMIVNHSRGWPWHKALPGGYWLPLFGAALFGLAGLGDMLWHLLFGIEISIEALFSPTHLLLAASATIIASGPVGAAWLRQTPPRHFADFLPMLISLTLAISVVTFITQFAQPFGLPLLFTGKRPDSTADYLIIIGTTSILLHTALLMGSVLVVLRRWTLPFGSLTLVFTLNAVLLSTQSDTYPGIVAALVGGLAADLLMRLLKPSARQPGRLRLFAFSVPVILYGMFFLVMALPQGIWLSIHVWTGILVMAGTAGLLLSYLAVPPRLPGAE